MPHLMQPNYSKDRRRQHEGLLIQIGTLEKRRRQLRVHIENQQVTCEAHCPNRCDEEKQVDEFARLIQFWFGEYANDEVVGDPSDPRHQSVIGEVSQKLHELVLDRLIFHLECCCARDIYIGVEKPKTVLDEATNRPEIHGVNWIRGSCDRG